MKRKIYPILPLLAATLTVSSCRDYDLGISVDEIKYKKEFSKAFGKIDPEQDWNLATRAVANVNLGEDATVKIYSESPLVTSAKLIANYQIEDSRTFDFDLPQGTKDVYVQAVSKRGAIVSGYYEVVDGIVNVNAHQAGAVTRATGPCPTTVATGDPTTLHVFYGQTWDNSLNEGWGDWASVTKEITMVNLENVHAERSTPWKVGDFRKVLDKYTDANGNELFGVFKETENNWLKWVQTGKLTGDVEFTMASTGPVSVTFNYWYTGTGSNNLTYFYYTGDRPDVENITLYNLIPSATNGGTESATGENRIEYKQPTGTWTNYGTYTDLWGMPDETQVKGTTYDLVYFDESGNASYDFPVGTHIVFAVVQANNQTGSSANSTDKCWFSVESMNPKADGWGFADTYGTYMPSAATFRMGDITFLGFEDWPDDTHDKGANDAKGGSDLNDLLFFAVGDFEEEIPDVDPDPVKYTQDWLLVYEDLGNSFDWDYNDVVLKVEHASGETSANITALAAGGTLSSHVFYNSTDLGEIHTWFGQEAAVSGANIVTNAESRGVVGETKVITVPATFSMTTLGSVADMGGLILKVKKAGETEFSSESTTIAYSLDNKGTAPEVICLPSSWTYTDNSGNYVRREFRWPAELQNIDKAYPHFKDWAANKSLYPGWYAEEPVLGYCVTGTFEQQVSSPTDRVDFTKSPANLALVGAVREVTIAGDETTAIHALAAISTDYTTESDAEVTYESSNTSLITVAVDGDNLVITRQTDEACVAYIKICQAANETHTAAKVNFIEVFVEEKEIEIANGNTYCYQGTATKWTASWGSEYDAIQINLGTLTVNGDPNMTITLYNGNPDDGGVVATVDNGRFYCDGQAVGNRDGIVSETLKASSYSGKTLIYTAYSNTLPSDPYLKVEVAE